ncbi:MAG: alkaline phosphatase D family protein [Pseudomonadales bacterium]|nr:alkaline phosphatase D family protein [Pseudomonadales bacterium]
MSVSRRSFLKGAAGTAGVASLPVLPGCVASAADNPFLHGVASGDPLIDRVILWTRITPYNAAGEQASPEEYPAAVNFRWLVAEDPELTSIVLEGEGETTRERDFTVKIDAAGLQPGATYYYRFESQGWASDTGRTKTLPVGHIDRLRIAMTSCSNWEYGYFNVYGAIAKREDLDVVLHLGDYIYEYGNGSYGSDKNERLHEPAHEIVTLSDYRTRHAQYKTDENLQEAHRQNPFITIWDDHESTNDSYSEGAENHTEGEEGNWFDRRSAAIQAYFEWMPIREQGVDGYGDQLIYRDFRFGDLIDLIMLDTRLFARTEPGAIGDLGTLLDPHHTLLGDQQESWLFDKLQTSQNDGTKWRVVGQQVMMAQLAAGGIGFNMDQWDGYPLSRERVFDFIQDNEINNFVVLTGDIHSSWANDLAPEPFNTAKYDRETGEGAIGVEFVTPGVSSPGIEDFNLAFAASFALKNSLPHMQMVDFFHRGFVLLDINHYRIQAEWHWVRSINLPSDISFFAKAFQTWDGRPALVQEFVETEPKRDAAPFAPKLATVDKQL